MIELYYISLAVYIKDTNYVLRHLRESFSKQNAISGRRNRVLEDIWNLLKISSGITETGGRGSRDDVDGTGGHNQTKKTELL